MDLRNVYYRNNHNRPRRHHRHIFKCYNKMLEVHKLVNNKTTKKNCIKKLKNRQLIHGGRDRGGARGAMAPPIMWLGP